MYDRYARVYDASGQVHFSLRMISYLAELLPRHGWRGRSALDLACGTGTLALSYAQQRLRAHGIDVSPSMLAMAREKAAELGLAVEWSCQDMRAFTLDEPVDLVTCCYDSLDYLLAPTDLAATFRGVAAALRPGGIFAFDVNTRWMYEGADGDTTFADGNGLAIVVQAAYERGSRLATWRLTGFVRQAEAWERFDETHLQRCHLPAEIAAALAEAGLVEEARYQCFSFDPPRPDATREMWVARKPR